MPCPIQNVLDYCAGKLSPDAEAEFERHMIVCAECKTTEKNQQNVWKALDTWEAIPVSEDFDRKLHTRIEEFEARSWRRRVWRPALSFGAASAAIAIALMIYTPGNRSENANVEVEPEQVERALEDLEMLKQLSNGSQTI